MIALDVINHGPAAAGFWIVLDLTNSDFKTTKYYFPLHLDSLHRKIKFPDVFANIRVLPVQEILKI